jgi:hypothetical protein
MKTIQSSKFKVQENAQAMRIWWAGTLLFLALMLQLLSPDCLFAAFKDSGWGVRPAGMGGAFTAIANDSNAPLFNAAGLAQLSQREATFMSSKLFTGLDGVDVGLNYLSYIQPVDARTGNFAFTWAALSSASLYREDTGSISYGRYLGNSTLAGGLSLKFLRHEYTLDARSADDPVFSNGATKNAVTADIGLLANIPDSGFSVGFAARNITSPDVGLKTADLLPLETVIGLAYYRDRMPYVRLPGCTVALDLVNRDKNVDYRLGAESWFFDGSFAVRAGGNSEELTLGLGYELNILKGTKLVIDYAFAWPLQIDETSGSHRIGVTLRLP